MRRALLWLGSAGGGSRFGLGNFPTVRLGRGGPGKFGGGAVIAAVLAEVRHRIATRTEAPNAERDELEAEAKRLRGEVDRLVAALASGVESPTIATVIGEREKRLAEVRARLEVLAVAPSVLDLEVRRLEREARARLNDFQALLGRNVAESRKALEALLDGPLRFEAVQTKDGRRFQIPERRPLGCFAQPIASPRGFEW